MEGRGPTGVISDMELVVKWCRQRGQLVRMMSWTSEMMSVEKDRGAKEE
jgi:predicted phosphatase